jgi:hypothetical protein
MDLTGLPQKRKERYRALVELRDLVDLGNACELASRLTSNAKLKLALLESAERLKGQKYKLPKGDR